MEDCAGLMVRNQWNESSLGGSLGSGALAGCRVTREARGRNAGLPLHPCQHARHRSWARFIITIMRPSSGSTETNAS